MGYTTLPLEDDMLDRFVELLGVGDNVENGTVDDTGSFVTRTDSSVPINRIRLIKFCT